MISDNEKSTRIKNINMTENKNINKIQFKYQVKSIKDNMRSTRFETKATNYKNTLKID